MKPSQKRLLYKNTDEDTKKMKHFLNALMRRVDIRPFVDR